MKEAFGFIIVEDDYTYYPTEEEERDHWNGMGHIEFYVSQNVPGCFEAEILDYSGCAGGMEETIGIEDMLEEWGLKDEVHEGVRYEILGLTVEWTRGDGWEIDDDVEYYFDYLVPYFSLRQWLKQKISNIWWRQVTTRIRTWRSK